MSTRPALGRGLNALIPRSRGLDAPPAPGAAAPPAGEPLRVPVGAIAPSPDQPRTAIDPVALEELAASIREHGVLQPLLVRRAGPDAYTLIAGERRWRAAQLAGLDRVPVIVADLADADLLVVALVENIQRQDLSPLEEALAYRRLVDEAHLTQDQIARRVGRSRVAVANALRLLHLPTDIRLSLAAGEITEGHARAILGALSEQQQLRLWRRVRARHLTVRQTESAARRARHDPADPAPAPRTPPGDRLAEQRLQRTLGTQVQVERGRQGAKGGRIVVRWYDDEHLEHLVAMLVRAAAEPPAAAPDHIDI